MVVTLHQTENDFNVLGDERMNRYIPFLMTVLISIPSHTQENVLHKTHISSHAAMQMVGVNDVRWEEGFWANIFEVCHTTMVPHIWHLFNNPEYSHAYNNFKVAAGLKEGRHRGAKFNDGELYKWLEAASYSLSITKDKQLNQLLDEIIEVIAKAQRADGYIHTPVIIAQRNGTTQEAWNDQLHFETYNIGHLLTAASAHYRATNKTALLEVAIKAANYLDRVSQENPTELASVTICPSHYMGIIDLYRVTNNSTFLDLATHLIDIRSKTKNSSDHNQDRIPFRKQTEAMGHAVRANYLYAGVADIYLETGDNTLLAPLESIWEDVAKRKMYITGSTGALYDGASPDGSKDHGSIQLIHQAYGRPYQLPNITAYNETCATIGNGLWNWRMLRLSGDSRYGDVLERALYNGILSGISLEGKHYFYTNPLRVESELPYALRWSRERKDYYGSFCCPPNIVRTIAGMNQYAYGISKNKIWVNLYGSNTLDTSFPDGSSIQLKQISNYPWDGKIALDIESTEISDFELMIRIPGWADKATISINGKEVSEIIHPGTYHSIQRTWKQSDEITIHFPMRIKLMEAHPLAEELRNQVAIKRGPIVYSLESADLPKDLKVSDVIIPRKASFKPSFEQNLLHGVTVIEGNVYLQENKDWEKQLYQEYKESNSKTIRTRFVPYYAWGNRGKTEMSVWFPVQ